MARQLATVELVEDDNGNVSARVNLHAELSELVRSAALEAIVEALAPTGVSLPDGDDLGQPLSPKQWREQWSREIERRIGQARPTVPLAEAIPQMFGALASTKRAG